MNKIAIIGSAGVPSKYGGFETLAHHLVNQLADKHQVSVYCSKHLYSESDRKQHWKGAKLVYVPLNANGIQSVPYDILSIFHALFYADTLLILGVSGCLILPFIKLFFSQKIIVNIDGVEWKRDKWKGFAKSFLKFSEKMAVKFADVVVADNEGIQEYVQSEYGKESSMIAYGADHVIDNYELKKEFTDLYPFLAGEYAFKVCRIEPENNVHMILNAFSQMPDKVLVIVGNWNKSDYGLDLKEKYSNCRNIFLHDPIYNQRLLDLLRSNCNLYVHGHSAGGTNPSLVEAMYLGLPIFAFDVNYNVKTTEGKALYFSDESDLVETIQNVSFYSLRSYGVEMQEVAKRRYTWDKIALSYEEIILGIKQPVLKPNVHISTT